MPDKPTQKHRELAVGTPLGEDVLLLTSMSGGEQLGRPFEYQLDMASENSRISPADIVGQNVTVRLELPTGKTRYFNGYVSRFIQLPPMGRFARYRATIVPWLWFLTRKADCCIFQKMKVPDIIKDVFKKCGVENFEDGLTGTYREWDYCVQYRETDFNFVNRLMEQEGIYYFFKHENGKHTMVLADSASAHEPYEGFEEIEYHSADKGTKSEQCISDWVVETNIQPGAYALNDFDFEDTRKDLKVRAKISRPHAQADFEIYDYPGEYTDAKKEGDGYAKTRIEELHAQYEVTTAGSDSRGLSTGFTFKLTKHPRDDQNREYLITSASYTVEGSEFFSSDSAGGATYSCSFNAIHVEQPFRPARITPKPSIAGPQTAIVVGQSGEEIHTDKYGRVMVKFHWDRYSKADEKSSCWIRVAQLWAGKGWGAMYIPRVGQEVIVEFLEGDPDRPIITGRVYNAQAMPPYDLPADKTKSTVKSSSSKGGGGFNEIRFEDKKGEEQVFIHGEKDLHIRVKNDRFETILNDRHLVIENDKFEHVKSHRNEFVDKNHLEEIGEDRNLTVKGKEAKQVDKNLSLTVKGNVEEAFKGDHTEETSKNYTLTAQQVTIEGKSKIELKVGGSKISMDSGQIEIKAPMVKIN
ncbi:MAG: type VI secretion system tip protein VgrG [Phycisphaerales bacterium]|nr:MAG: type VI secretion system tip protein VgrG [Phycisphaerales bacterium]